MTEALWAEFGHERVRQFSSLQDCTGRLFVVKYLIPETEALLSCASFIDALLSQFLVNDS